LLSGLGQASGRARTTEQVAAAVSKPVKVGALREALTSALGGTPTVPAATTRSKWALDEHMAARLPLRILVAEDNVVNQKVVVKMLGRLGYRVEVVNNGLEAVEAIGRQRYDVLLLDVQMPIMDGFEAARRLRAAQAPAHRPRIVGMTALAMTGDRERCLEAGMDDYISKPVRPEELQRALERAAVTPPIDEEVIANLRELQDPDESDFVAELIDVLLGDAPARFEALRGAIAAADATTVNRTAHSLKSSCGNLGARTLAGLLAGLEKKGLEQDMVGAAALLTQVTAEFERVRCALLELRGASSEAA
jgi:CheY-like chemotaxis protein